MGWTRKERLARVKHDLETAELNRKALNERLESVNIEIDELTDRMIALEQYPDDEAELAAKIADMMKAGTVTDEAELAEFLRAAQIFK